MQARVVDASVLAAFAFQEPQAQEAGALLKGIRIFAPTLLPYELASIARKKSALYPDKRSIIMDALDICLEMDMTLSEPEYRDLSALSLETGLTVYDSAYLWLARSLGIELVTFDRRLSAISTKRSH